MHKCEIRATFSDKTIRVYQAFRPEIAKAALANGTFVPPFSMTRMTWIKTSFYWMMHRSRYASRSGQEMVLGIDITREGFHWALEQAVLSSFNRSLPYSHGEWHKALQHAPVRVQWDPERDWQLQSVPNVRTIQIGLAGEAVKRYVSEWIVRVQDMTSIAHRLASCHERLRPSGNSPVESERPYPLDPVLKARLCKTIVLS